MLLIIKFVKFCYHLLIQLRLKIKFNKSDREIYVFDLDNTLYNTWPFLKNINEDLYGKVPIFEGMQNIVNNVSKDVRLVFLTARKMKYYIATKNRLKFDFTESNYDLIMVNSAKDKIKYLEFFIAKSTHVVYYDDLSYNHENGEIKFYDETIQKVRELSLEYQDVKAINKINRV